MFSLSWISAVRKLAIACAGREPGLICQLVSEQTSSSPGLKTGSWGLLLPLHIVLISVPSPQHS